MDHRNLLAGDCRDGNPVYHTSARLAMTSYAVVKERSRVMLGSLTLMERSGMRVECIQLLGTSQCQ